MEYAILALCLINLALIVFLLIRKKSNESGQGVDKIQVKEAVNESINSMSGMLLGSIENTNKIFSRAMLILSKSLIPQLPSLQRQ